MPTVVQDVSGDTVLQNAIAALKAKIEGAEESSDIAQAVSQISSLNEDIANSLDSVDTEIGELKENINDNVYFVGGRQNTFSFDSGSAITTEKTTVNFNAKAGEIIKIAVTGNTAPSGELYFYVRYSGETSFSYVGIGSFGTYKLVTLTKDINAVAFYVTSYSDGNDLILHIKSESHGLYGDVVSLRDDVVQIVEDSGQFVEKEDYIITEELSANYWLQSGRIFGRYGLLFKGGTIQITAIPSSYQIAIRSWVNSNYTNKDQDTEWLSTPGTIINVKPDRYYDFVMRFMNGQTEGTIADISAVNGVELDYTFELKPQVLDNSTNIKNIYNIISHTPPTLSNTVRTIAHRGDQHEAPRNTAPAYIIARNRGVLIAENDVTLSSDNAYVCWHDTTFAICGNLVDINGYLMYTDGTNFYYVKEDVVYTWNESTYSISSVPISSLTRCAGSNYTPQSLSLSVMKRIDVGKYKGVKFAGTQILTFEEWVLLCKQLGMEIYVDRKIDWTNTQLTELAQIVKRLGMGKYSSWLSIYGQQIPVLRDVIPDARVGLLSHPSDSAVESYAQYNVGRGVFFNGDAKNGLSASVVQKALDAGYEVEAYYVDYGSSDTEETILSNIRTYVGYGLTGLTLDHYTVDDAFEYLKNEY